jgi:hypothetical protein
MSRFCELAKTTYRTGKNRKKLTESFFCPLCFSLVLAENKGVIIV